MDHHPKTAENDYSLASTTATQYQENAHAAVQADFLQKAQLESTLPSFIKAAITKVNSLVTIAVSAERKRRAAKGIFYDDTDDDEVKAADDSLLDGSDYPDDCYDDDVDSEPETDIEPGEAGVSQDRPNDPATQVPLNPAATAVAAAVAAAAATAAGVAPKKRQLTSDRNRNPSPKKRSRGSAIGGEGHLMRLLAAAACERTTKSLAQQPANIPELLQTTLPLFTPPPAAHVFQPTATRCFAMMPRSRNASPVPAELEGLVGLVRARSRKNTGTNKQKDGGTTAGCGFRLRVRWVGRATTSVIGVEDVICRSEDDARQLPPVVIEWVTAACRARDQEVGGQSLESSWWARVHTTAPGDISSESDDV
jgi:hypothetical protein